MRARVALRIRARLLERAEHELEERHRFVLGESARRILAPWRSRTIMASIRKILRLLHRQRYRRL